MLPGPVTVASAARGSTSVQSDDLTPVPSTDPPATKLRGDQQVTVPGLRSGDSPGRTADGRWSDRRRFQGQASRRAAQLDARPRRRTFAGEDIGSSGLDRGPRPERIGVRGAGSVPCRPRSPGPSLTTSVVPRLSRTIPSLASSGGRRKSVTGHLGHHGTGAATVKVAILDCGVYGPSSRFRARMACSGIRTCVTSSSGARLHRSARRCRRHLRPRYPNGRHRRCQHQRCHRHGRYRVQDVDHERQSAWGQRFRL